MNQIFYKVGHFSSANPWMAVIFTLTVTTVLGLGLYNLYLETDPQNLWVSSFSRTYKEQQDFAKNFGAFYRTNQFMMLPRNDEDVVMFNKTEKSGLKVIYFLQAIINNYELPSDGKNITLNDLCFKPVSGKGCLAPSPMDIWLQDPILLDADEDLQRTTLCTHSVDQSRTNIPCSDINGIPVIREAVFSGRQKTNLHGSSCEDRIPDDQPCDHCYITAKALSITYLLNNGDFTNKDALKWELNVFMETMRKFNARDYDWLRKRYNQTYPPPADAVMDRFQVVYLSERSVSDELEIETNQNLWVVLLSYLLMFIYISVALGEFPSSVYNSFLLGFGGILIVAFSMIGSVGMVSYVGVGMTMISAEVIPFLILAIGVDNMFIISHAYQKITDSISVEDRMGKTIQAVGPSITTAAFCETLAFVVGALTKMPALQSFCMQAAIGVILDFIFVLTFFVAILTWDERRKREQRFDIFFCWKAKEHKQPNSRKLASKIMHNYIKVLQNNVCKAIVFIIFAGLFIISCIGTYKLETGLEEQVSMVSGGDLDNYFTYEKKYIEIGPPAYVVLKGFNYSDNDDISFVSRMSNALSQLNTTVQPPIYSWVSGFNLFLNDKAEWTKYCGTEDIKLDDFPTQLRRFVNTKITSQCCQRFGICGEQFQADIVTDDEGYVKTSRLRYQHRPIHNSKEYILTFEQTRQVVDKLGKDLGPDQSVYAYSLPYIFYDQYSYIRAVAIQNVLLGLATIFLTITFIQDVTCAIIVSITVFIISFNLVGLVWLLNWIFGGFQVQINAISVVNLVTCLGLAVEFCVHIVIKFRTTAGDRKSRVNYSMQTMGTSVLVGIASTKFIGVIVLAFAPSILFRLYYFRMYILMVVTGAFNGLCLLPIVLSIIGPDAVASQKILNSVTTDSDNPSSTFKFNHLN